MGLSPQGQRKVPGRERVPAGGRHQPGCGQATVAASQNQNSLGLTQPHPNLAACLPIFPHPLLLPVRDPPAVTPRAHRPIVSQSTDLLTPSPLTHSKLPPTPSSPSTPPFPLPFSVTPFSAPNRVNMESARAGHEAGRNVGLGERPPRVSHSPQESGASPEQHKLHNCTISGKHPFSAPNYVPTCLIHRFLHQLPTPTHAHANELPGAPQL